LIYSFGGFRLDTAQFRLTDGGAPVHVEPLVFDLLRLFVENAGAVVDRDRMLAEVWDGRFVSEATLSTAVKSARRALGDSGEAQAWIETVRGRGFRFKGAVAAEIPARPALPAEEPGAPEAATRAVPSIAVLPFVRLGDGGPYPGLEDALPHEVIGSLARLRWLFVIARGSAFRFRGPAVDIALVGRSLGVRYCLTGALEVFAGRLTVAVELAETGSGGVIWGERFEGALDDVHGVRAEIVRGITVALEVQIQLHEALRAQGRPAENLDAWAAFHLGLKQMHLYTREGNVAAEALFRRAVALEPGFARAHAGLSFVHFQNAFLRHTPDRAGETLKARRRAEQGLDLDPLDPFVNFNLGRSYWLQQDIDGAMPWLERATELSPNYAQGLYSRALMDSLSGRSTVALATADQAIGLSPLDPLLYAMRATKALARIADGDLAEAARWAEVAARTPRAHVIIAMIAAASHALADDPAAARRWAAAVRRARPDADRSQFFDALPVQDPATRRRLIRGLAACGF
jgi:TolB-like protein